MSQTNDIYTLIKEKIVKGEYPPSVSLTETDLATQFSASRNTIKKVLLMLEKENLVTIEQNKSAKVRSFTLDQILKYLELREVLEGFIIRKAIDNITKGQIVQLKQILSITKMHLQNRNLLEYSINSQLFHQVIYDACPNEEAINITVTLKNQISKYDMKTILVPGRDIQSFSEHSDILDAIERKDADQAELLMRRHVSNVRKVFSDNYSLLF